MKLFSIIVAIILFLMGCSSVQPKKEVIIKKEFVERECVTALPDNILLKNVDFIVDGLYYKITIPHYENLSYNTAELYRYGKQSKVIIKKCM